MVDNTEKKRMEKGDVTVKGWRQEDDTMDDTS
jgi:hypothetical protein